MSEIVNWPARRAAVFAADGSEWDRLDQAYRSDWKAVYAAAFVAVAVERKWSRADAETWPSEIADDAMVEAEAAGRTPEQQAACDVTACEIEAEGA